MVRRTVYSTIILHRGRAVETAGCTRTAIWHAAAHMTEPAKDDQGRPPRMLTGSLSPGEDLTAAQRLRLERRAKERRRVTPKALSLRVEAVAEAYIEAQRTGDRQALVGALENLASACMAWARWIRSTHRL